MAPSASPLAARSRRTFALRAAVAVALALGVAGYFVARERAEEAAAVARRFFAAVPAATASGPDHALTLARGGMLRLSQVDANGRRLHALSFRVAEPEPGAVVEIWFREAEGGLYRAVVTTGAALRAQLIRREAAAPPAVLAEAAAPPRDATEPQRIQLYLDGGDLVFGYGAAEPLRVRDATLAAGAVSIRAPAGGFRVEDLSVAGRETDGRPFTAAAAADAPWRRRALDCVRALLAALAAGGLLRALCLGRPAFVRLAGATALGLLPLALAFTPALFGAAPPGTALLAAAALAGLVLGMLRLRGFVRVPAPRPGPVRLALLGVAAFAAAALAIGRAERAALEPVQALAASEHDVGSWLHPDSPPAAGPIRLDAGNSLRLAEWAGAARVRLAATLEPDAILEVRLRATPDQAEGIAFFLSADPRIGSGFYQQDVFRHRALGARGPAVRPGERCEVSIGFADRGLEATVAGERIRAVDPWFTGGEVLLLAAHGAVELESAALDSRDIGELLEPIAGLPPWPPVAFWLGFALLTAWLLRLPAANVLAAHAFAFAPLALAAGDLERDGVALTAASFAIFGLLAVLLAHLQIHARALTPLRFLAWLVAALLGAPFAALSWLGVRGGEEAGQVASLPETGLAPLHDDRLYLLQPSLRRLNDSLIAHRFRGRSFSAAKPAGVKRVIALGGSSTWGYGIPENSGLDYPTQVERILNAAGAGAPAVEVINAGYEGTIGPYLFRLLRDQLVDFAPDVVTVSLTYNDSFAHTQWNVDAYLRGIDGKPFHARFLRDVLARAELSRARGELNQLLEAFKADGAASTLEVWQRLGHADDAEAPPRRFEAMLRGFLDLGRARGFRVVLVKEPLRGDQRMIWKDEFRAVIDRLAEEYGAIAVDPTPALAAAGGARLFMDEVHPTAEGCRAVAEALAPAVRQAIGSP